MKYRYIAAAVTLAAASGIAAYALGSGATGNSEAGRAAAGTWTHPRTAWGDPDLQGVWRYEAAIA